MSPAVGRRVLYHKHHLGSPQKKTIPSLTGNQTWATAVKVTNPSPQTTRGPYCKRGSINTSTNNRWNLTVKRNSEGNDEMLTLLSFCEILDSKWPIFFRGSFVRIRSAVNFFFFSFIFISWRLITSQHCSGFGHTLTWISHGVTCIPHPDPPSHLPLHPIPLGLPSAPGPSTCLMHPTWAGDLSHYR